LVIALLAAGCSDKFKKISAADAGPFVIPDSGFIWDGGMTIPDTGPPPDSGPFQCTPACSPDGSVCSCLDTHPPTCGCNLRQGYLGPCDPQVATSCKWPFKCVYGRELDGYRWICSDGRTGTPCSHTSTVNTCNTFNGCQCQTTPLGSSCTCAGATGPSPLICDPTMHSTCPEGVCIDVVFANPDGGSFDIHICSGGSEGEPCVGGDMTCHTSIGCTCPYTGIQQLCRCSEPGTYQGYACDPRVDAACQAPFFCGVRADPGGGFISECTTSGAADGGVDPYSCDPSSPTCPTGYACSETPAGSGVFRCVPM
jgi:hypothetical protein